MYVGSWRRIPKSHVPSQIDFPILRIWKLMAWCATYSFAYGVCTSIAIPASYDIAYFARIIPNILVVVGVLFFAKHFSLNIIYGMSMPVFILGCLLIAPVPDSIFTTFVLELGDELFSILFFTVALAVAYRNRVSAAFLCGVVFFERMFFELVGNYMYKALGLLVGSTAIALGLTVLICMASLLIFKEKDLLEVWDTLGIENADDPDRYALIHSLATERNLSSREESVLRLMAAGASNTDIANELFIAPETARAHISHIYTKLGVRNRQELTHMLEGHTVGVRG